MPPSSGIVRPFRDISIAFRAVIQWGQQAAAVAIIHDFNAGLYSSG